MEQNTPIAVRRDRMTFYPVVITSSIFCVSIFVVISATFGDQNVPANQWVNRHANTILIVETVVLMVSVIAAMTIDRRRTLRQMAAANAEKPADSADAHPHPGGATDVD